LRGRGESGGGESAAAKGCSHEGLAVAANVMEVMLTAS